MDPYVAAALEASKAIADAVKSENMLDLELIKHDEAYRAVVIAERTQRKEFWKPLLDILGKLKVPTEP